MKRDINEIYYPLSIPRPERLKRWSRATGYAEAELLSKGRVAVVRYQVPARNRSATGKRLVFASDFHFRNTLHCRQLLAEMVRKTTELKPDVLVLGGDLISDAVEIRLLPELLDALRPTAPVRIGVPGNWERGKNWISDEEWCGLYRKHGFEFLGNRLLQSGPFNFHGSDDLCNHTPLLPEEWPEGAENILITHRPDTAIALDRGRSLAPVDLILCGHTHGGQIRLPFIGPLYASSNYGIHFSYGTFRREGLRCRLIVSSGLGERSLAWRFNCRRELVLIEFTGE